MATTNAGESADAPARAPPEGVAASSSASNAPPGHRLRRSQTVGDASPMRRRPLMSHITTDPPLESLPRRSSNFSDYSLGDARDLLNPKPLGSGESSNLESSSLASISLAVALLPAVAGALFKDGSSVVTDIMLLGLSAVFLNWSVTQPWSWYRSAQEARIQQEAQVDAVAIDDSDLDADESDRDGSPPLADVPEDGEVSKSKSNTNRATGDDKVFSKQQTALTELYIHEVLALMSCLLLPLVAAYLLHTIRSQLSRPSEGLVSNYNLTIFVMVSELRVFSHMLKLVQSRTLHLRRVVENSPFPSSVDAGTTLKELYARLERLEFRSSAEEAIVQQGVVSDSARVKQEAAVTRDVRNAIQPELDALNRAVRRYEKKATMLQFQTESRFAAVDARLDDAIALAAAAAKNSVPNRNVMVRGIESVAAIILFPFSTVLQVLLLPLKSLVAMVSGNKHNQPPPRSSRPTRTSKVHSQSRYSGDRMPTRVTKR